MDILLQQVINGLVLGSMYALIALGYTMVYGIINLINFAHGEVMMVGALTSTSSDRGRTDSLLRAAVTVLSRVASGMPLPVWVSTWTCVVPGCGLETLTDLICPEALRAWNSKAPRGPATL